MIKLSIESELTNQQQLQPVYILESVLACRLLRYYKLDLCAHKQGPTRSNNHRITKLLVLNVCLRHHRTPHLKNIESHFARPILLAEKPDTIGSLFFVGEQNEE